VVTYVNIDMKVPFATAQQRAQSDNSGKQQKNRGDGPESESDFWSESESEPESGKQG
jgi:hypothetical protein